MKFAIDIDHPLAWHVVQELGHVLNYLSITEKLPTPFKPVSPPPYLNGGPRAFLAWVIECADARLAPATVAEWLEGRLPRPSATSSSGRETSDCRRGASRPPPARVLESPACASSTASA